MSYNANRKSRNTIPQPKHFRHGCRQQRRAIASYRVRHNKRCKVLVSQMSATVYYRLSADASLGYRRNGRSQSSPPAFSSNEIPFPISAGCYSAKLNLDAIALVSSGMGSDHSEMQFTRTHFVIASAARQSRCRSNGRRSNGRRSNDGSPTCTQPQRDCHVAMLLAMTSDDGR